MGPRAKRRDATNQDPEGIYLDNIADLRMATDRAYQRFSEVMLLRGSIDFARAHKGIGRAILDHCRRALMRFERMMTYVGRILKRLTAHLSSTLNAEAQAFCDSLEHILAGVTEAVETRIVPKIIEVRSRVSSFIDEPDKLDRALFQEGKDSIFCTVSVLVEAADQIRRQLPKDWTIDSIKRFADPANANGSRKTQIAEPVGIN